MIRDQRVVAERSADAREGADGQALDQAAARGPEHAADRGQQESAVQDAGRHRVAHADGVPDEVAKRGGRGNDDDSDEHAAWALA